MVIIIIFQLVFCVFFKERAWLGTIELLIEENMVISVSKEVQAEWGTKAKQAGQRGAQRRG